MKRSKRGEIGILNVRILLKNKIWVFGVFLVLFFSFFIMLYQEKNEPVEGVYRKECIEWLQEQVDPEMALAQYRLSMIETKEYLFTGNVMDEWRLLEEVGQYIRYSCHYQEQIEQICQDAIIGQHFSNTSESMRLKYRISGKAYEKLKDTEIVFGNYLTWEKFLQNGVAEFAFVLLILITVFYLIIQERERGMSSLVHATTYGGKEYFVQKLVAAEISCTLLFIVVYTMKWWVYAILYGTGELQVPVQSLSGFTTCPYAWTIGQYTIYYLIFQYMFWMFVTLLIVWLASLPLSESGLCMVMMSVVGVSALVVTMIPEYSSWIVIRNIMPTVLGDFLYWTKGIFVFHIAKIAGKDIYVGQLAFPVLMICIISLIIIVCGRRLYERGLHESSKKRHYFHAWWKFRCGSWMNEISFLMLQKKQALLGIVLIVVACAVFDFQPDHTAYLEYEKELLETLNSKSFAEACEWLEDRQQQYDNLKKQQDDILAKLIAGEMSADDYEHISMMISQQLELEPLVQQYARQVEKMQPLISEGHTVHFEYESLTGELFGDEGRENRLFSGMLLSVFVILTALTILPMDRGRGVNILLGTTRYGESAVISRIVTMALLTAILSVAINGLNLYSIICRFGWSGCEYELQSWARYRTVKWEMLINTGIMLQLLWSGCKWFCIAFIAGTISLFSKKVIWMEMCGIFLFVGSLLLDVVGIQWIKELPHERMMLWGEMDFLTNWSWGIGCICIVLVTYGIMIYGVRRWMQ